MRLFLLLCLALLRAPLLDAQSSNPLPSQILFLIWDDVGADSLEQIDTPNVDALASAGVTFEAARSHPWCKRSRWSLLLGSFSGEAAGESCLPVNSRAVDTNAPTFVGTLRAAGMTTAAVGKWHLGRAASNGLPWWFAPHALGFDHWRAGLATAIPSAPCPNPNMVHDDGAFYAPGRHATLVQRDALFSLMDEANLANRPLFAWVGFTDAHSPWAVPPSSILPQGYRLPLNPTDRDYFKAEVVALDFVLGEIMERANPDAWIVLMSENGTPKDVIRPVSDRAKTTVWEGGVRVPLIFSGPGLVPGRRFEPVQLYDLPRTLLDSLGLVGPVGVGRNILANPGPDPFSFVMNQTPGENQSRAVVEMRWKLIDHATRGLEFYDLASDPTELVPLPHVGPDFDRLSARLAALPTYK